jgi:phage shock protein A
VKKLGIIDRIKLNARANLNYILDKAENPQKMLDQFLLDMRGSVQEVREAVANAIVGVKKLEHEISDSSEKTRQWEERALLALKKDNEELARKALERKISYEEKERRYKDELEKQKQTVEELKVDLAELEVKLDELYQKRVELIKQYAQLQKRVVQTSTAKPVVSEINLDISAFDIYDHMVDRVMMMETQAEALSELSAGDKVEEKFRKLESESKIETELKAMKDKSESQS